MAKMSELLGANADVAEPLGKRQRTKRAEETVQGVWGWRGRPRGREQWESPAILAAAMTADLCLSEKTAGTEMTVMPRGRGAAFGAPPLACRRS